MMKLCSSVYCRCEHCFAGRSQRSRGCSVWWSLRSQAPQFRNQSNKENIVSNGDDNTKNNKIYLPEYFASFNFVEHNYFQKFLLIMFFLTPSQRKFGFN